MEVGEVREMERDADIEETAMANHTGGVQLLEKAFRHLVIIMSVSSIWNGRRKGWHVL